jgi:predicted helicase
MSSISSYLDTVSRYLQTGNATEHTYRPALQQLLNTLLPNCHITNEPRRIECGSPDFEIVKNQEPIGYIEAKEIGANLAKIEKTEQLQRYIAFSNNIILTDYLEFRWFVNGCYQEKMTVKLADVKNGKLTIHKESFERLEALLTSFIETQIITLNSPETLAEKMAHIAKEIRHSILLAYQLEDAQGKIHEQLQSFHDVLINTITISQFADMIAQTICYGLFSAKCNALNESFSRITAGYFISKTNPFLQQFFNQHTGINLDEDLIWAVDNLIAVLNRANISAILANFGKKTLQEDPVIHFYETFLRHYDAKLRELRGVYYTPEPVVSYIVRSVDLILKNEFNLRDGLADNSKIDDKTHKVQILDPATGTGTFLSAVIEKIYQHAKKIGNWSNYVNEHLLPRVHGFELLMAAYTIAHLKLSLQLREQGYSFKSDKRLNIFLTNTLDEGKDKQQTVIFAKWLSDEANKANAVKQDSPVMVILGNPPYSNYGMLNTGDWILNLLKDYKKNLNEKKLNLNEDSIKFIRFGQWRIEQTGMGILAFITSNTFIDGVTHKRMRESLMQSFDEIYILDLHGSIKKNDISPDGSKDENVFDIQQGVSISLFIKYPITKNLLAKVYYAELFGLRKVKYTFLSEKDIKSTKWTELKPKQPDFFFVPKDFSFQEEYNQYIGLKEIFTFSGSGVKTERDRVSIHLTKQEIENTVKNFKTLSEFELRDKYNLDKDSRDWKVNNAVNDVLENVKKNCYTNILYRPFDIRYTWYSGKTRGFIGTPGYPTMQHMLERDNLALLACRQQSKIGFRHIYCSNYLTEGCTVSSRTREITSVFPLYIHSIAKNDLVSDIQKQDTNRQANFSDSFIKELENRLKLKFIIEDKGDFEVTISTLNVFHYMYAVFHSPTYRKRYAEFLKIDFPRLPLTSNKKLFKSLADLGEQLVELHLMKAHIEYNSYFPIEGDNIVEKIEYKDNKVYINKTQYFDNVSLNTWEFHIGGYQVCQKWLKDRKARELSYEDCKNYLYILAALEKTQSVMTEIDNYSVDWL